jgi:hypothetical protein
LFERFVERQEVIGAFRRGELGRVKIKTILASAAASCMHPPGAFDQDPAHRFSRRGEEMAAAIPSAPLGADQSQIGLVNQCSRLKRLARPFLDHLLRG